MQLTAVLSPAEEGGFVALNPETGTSSQGESIEEALADLREATELYLEEVPDHATSDRPHHLRWTASNPFKPNPLRGSA